MVAVESALWVNPDELGHYFSTSEYAMEACQTASYLLWVMSGRKFSGTTTVTERYTCVRSRPPIGPSSKTVSPILFSGDVYHIPAEDYEDYTEMYIDGVSVETKIRLRGRPVKTIHSIRDREGNFLDPSTYYMSDHATVHIKGASPWTSCNTEITYTYGSPPPIAGKMAAKMLATELIRLWSGDEECSLPQRITSVTRQGVSFTILDQQDFIDEMKTGIYAIDLFLKSVNPDRARSRSRVFSVDVPRGRRYVPKPLNYPKDSSKDIYVSNGLTGAITVDLDAVSADFLLDEEEGWTPFVSILNWSQARSREVSGAVSIDTPTESLTITLPYKDVYQILGAVDPGSYELYASRPDPETPNIQQIVLIYSANLKVNLSS